jgi:hypothetical protein
MRLPGAKGRGRGAEGKIRCRWLAIIECVLSWIAGALSTAAALVVLVAMAGVTQAAAARAAERLTLLNEVAASIHLESARCAVPPSRNGTRTRIELGSAGVTRTSAATTPFCRP